MTENEWTESIMKKMMGFLEDNVLYADSSYLKITITN